MDISEFLDALQCGDEDAILDLPYVLERGTFQAYNGRRLDDAMYESILSDSSLLDILLDAQTQPKIIAWLSEAGIWDENERYQALIAYENMLDDLNVLASLRSDDGMIGVLTTNFRNMKRNSEVADRILAKISGRGSNVSNLYFR